MLCAGHLVKYNTTPLKTVPLNTIGDGLSGKGKGLAKVDGMGRLDLSKPTRQVMVAMEPYRNLGYPISLPTAPGLNWNESHRRPEYT